MHEGVLKRHAARLPLTEATPALTIGEGDTPLVRSRNLEGELGVGALYFKLEGCNPTGSFKDRGMVVAVAKAMEDGMSRLLCASTGNTSASAAAYGAAAGLETVVLVPQGGVAPGKMSQAVAYGARVVAIEGAFDDALRVARELTDYAERFALVNSVNPHRIAGQKTAAFEIVDDLGDAPDYLFIPVGNAGNITAYWAGFCEYARDGVASRRPRMMGAQAAGAAPIVNGAPVPNPETVASAIRIAGQKTAAFEIVDDLGDAPDYLFIPVGNAGNITAYWAGFCEYARDGVASRRPRMMGAQAAGAAPIVNGAPVPNPETVASAIRIGAPANWARAVAARDESGGAIDAVTDEAILEAYAALPAREGIFCEPASAAGVAALIARARAGQDFSSASVVCVITGAGLKDAPVAERLAVRPPETAPPDMESVARLIERGQGA